MKNTIKSLDYDPFIQASNYEEALAEKAAKKAQSEAERQGRLNRLAEKRARKLAELEAQRDMMVEGQD